MKLLTPILTFAALAFSSNLMAATTGWADPYGRTTNAVTTQFAVWDTFNEAYSAGTGASTTYTYSGNAAGSSTLTGLGLQQSSAHINAATGGGSAQGAGLLNSGDIYYSSTRAQSWTLSVTSSLDVEEMTFQVKTANIGGNITAGSVGQLFLPTLAGYGAATFIGYTAVTGESSNGFDLYTLEYRWFDLDIQAGTAMDITFGLVGGSTGNFTRKPIDFVSLDASSVASVPEPGVAGLFGIALAGLMLRRRR